MIRCEGLTRRFDDRGVLDGVSFTVERGERVALVGPNGSGKTTLFRCLLGLIPFDGDIRIDECPVGPDGREARARTAYVPQRPPRFDLRLTEFLELFSAARGVDASRALDYADRLGLSERTHGNKWLRELSGGMLQKAVLALALGAPVPVLLLDEPTASLDAVARSRLLQVLAEESPGRTILIASHQADDVQALTSRALTLELDGSVTAGPDARSSRRSRLDPTSCTPGRQLGLVYGRAR